MFTQVTTIEIPNDTPVVITFELMKAIPILIPKEIPKRIIVRIHVNTFLQFFLCKGKPTFFHFIYSGSGALLTFTLFIGNSLYLQQFQKFAIEGGLFLDTIYLIA